MLIRQAVPVILLITLIMSGCSGNDIPLNPPISESGIFTSETPDRESDGKRMLWGTWQIAIDTPTLETTIIPLRSGNLHINALMFLEPLSGSTIGISNVTIDGTIIGCDVTLIHPFPGLNQYAGFDVRRVLISRGTLSGYDDPDIVISGPGETRLLNADGLTRWWNPVEFPDTGSMFSYCDGKLGTPDSAADYNATISGYKAFADCLNADDPATMLVDPGLSSGQKRALFSPGQANTRHYEIEFADDGSGDPLIIFNYAVDASWEDVQPPPDTLPDDFPLSANCEEAFLIEFVETSNTLYYTSEGEGGGSLGLDIKVHDWQGALGTGTNCEGSCVDVVVESPDLFGGPQATIAIPGSGTGETYSTWHAEIACVPQSNDDQMLLITAVSAFGDWQPEFTGYSGSAPLAAYQVAWVSVGSEPPYNSTLTILSPNGGESWSGGCPYDIGWESEGDPIDNVKLEYSLDGFLSDVNVIVESTINDGLYNWELPDIESDSVRVRVSDVVQPSIFDISDNDFSIGASGPAIWQTAKYDYQNLGVSPNAGPTTNNLKWSTNIGAQMTPGPVIGMDGTIYVGTNDGRLFAVDPNGNILWQLNLGSFVLGSASINDEGRIYVGSWGSPTGYLYAIECGGDIIWQFACGGNINKATPVIGDDGTVYIGNNNGRLWAVNDDGSEKWHFDLGGGFTPSPALGTDGSVYVTGTGGHIYGITDNGQGSYSVFWDHVFPGDQPHGPPTVQGNNPLVSNDVVYATCLYANLLYALDPVTDTILWTGATGGGFGETCATVGPDHTVYIGCNDSNVYAFDQSGTQQWTFSTGNQVAAGPVLDPYGRLYVPSRDGNIYCLDSTNGSQIWSYSTGGGMIRSEVAIGPDGTLYVSGHSGILRAFQDE